MQNVSIIALMKKKKPTHTYGTIYIRGFLNRKPVAALSTGHQIQVQHWDADKRQVSDKAPNARLINTCIEIKLQQMKAALMKAEIMGASINKSAIAAVVRGNESNQNFITFCKERIKENYSSKQTIRSYHAECSKIENFAGSVLFNDINYAFLERYKNYMRDKLQNHPNTIWKSLKFLNTMLNLAIKHGGIIDENPLKNFDRGKYVNSEKIWLEISECEKIYQVACNQQHALIIRQVAVYFLLMCYSGLRFEDAILFDPDVHIIEKERIVQRTSKKGIMVNIFIYDRLAPVIALVKENRLKITNQPFNRYLKLVATAAGINKNLTSHVGRHSMGGFLSDARVKEEEAQKILGHGDIRSTKVYYHMKNERIDNAVQQLNNL